MKREPLSKQVENPYDWKDDEYGNRKDDKDITQKFFDHVQQTDMDNEQEVLGLTLLLP